MYQFVWSKDQDKMYIKIVKCRSLSENQRFFCPYFTDENDEFNFRHHHFWKNLAGFLAHVFNTIASIPRYFCRNYKASWQRILRNVERPTSHPPSTQLVLNKSIEGNDRHLLLAKHRHVKRLTRSKPCPLFKSLERFAIAILDRSIDLLPPWARKWYRPKFHIQLTLIVSIIWIILSFSPLFHASRAQITKQDITIHLWNLTWNYDMQQSLSCDVVVPIKSTLVHCYRLTKQLSLNNVFQVAK